MKKQTRTQQILYSTRALMLKKGYHSTRLDDICEATMTPKGPLSKGGLFHHFKSKEDIGRRMLRAYMTEMLQPYQSMVDAPSPKSFLSLLSAQLSRSEVEILEGSLLGILAQELSQSDTQLQHDIQQHLLDWQQTLETYFEKIAPLAKHSYVSKDLATFYMALLEGSFLLGRSLQDVKTFRSNLKQFKLYFSFLFSLND